jgi:hypothetical protein
MRWPQEGTKSHKENPGVSPIRAIREIRGLLNRGGQFFTLDSAAKPPCFEKR